MEWNALNFRGQSAAGSRHRYVRRMSIALAAAVLVAAPVVGQVGTLSGKQSAFVRQSDTLVLSASPTGIASVTLAKGRKNRNLVADVTVQLVNGVETNNAVFSLEVNGFGTFPTSWVVSCNPPDVCLGSMTWWVDLDDLEENHPGAVIKQPLDIQLRLAADDPLPSTPTGYIVQMGARLQHK